jgi:excinuclease ABC subunit A
MIAAVEKITVRGAREHNLKNIDVDIPRNRLVVVTGVSGSGKSSLAFDTIYAEGQRRYVESLSAYARQFLGQMEKPDVDSIDGLSPAIAIEQRTAARNPRSTVATTTEIYDHLRLLFARVGRQHCHRCGREIGRQTIEEMVDRLLALPGGTRVLLLAPLVRGRKGEHLEVLAEARRQGFLRARVNGEIRDLDGEDLVLDKKRKHTIEVVVDRLEVQPEKRSRFHDSLETALKTGGGVAEVLVVGGASGAGSAGGRVGAGGAPAGGEPILFSESAACLDCGVSFEALEPRNFSFNSPYGACRDCDGLGTHLEMDPDLVVPDQRLSINEGAIKPWRSADAKWYGAMLATLAKNYDFSLDQPFGKLPKRARDLVLHGSGRDEIDFNWKSKRMTAKIRRPFEGVIPSLARRYRQTGSNMIREWIAGFMSPRSCASCGGRRLKPESLAVRVGGRSIGEVTALSVSQCLDFVAQLTLTPREEQIARDARKEIRERLTFLADVGLDYLTLDRSAATLSGGEAQRIRLATQVGSRLTGVLYVLDEPSIGLHPRDTGRLLRTLAGLRDLGNTVLVVEHDRDTIEAADFVIDLGPGAGVHGGEVVAAGTPAEIRRDGRSLTGLYLAGTRAIPARAERRAGNGKTIRVVGARANNLKTIDVEIPLGTFTCVTGVSGSGKSTLVNDILHRGLARILYRAGDPPGAHERIEGIEHIDKVVDIDQSPIGRTPRSNPATYTGAFDQIRTLFAALPEAKTRGYGPGRFSFNVKGGRCEACAGDGVTRIEMHFLPDVFVTCDVCRGKRFSRETLEVRYRGASIADVLAMTVEEACSFFAPFPALARRLGMLAGVGLGYVHLGQPATTLSGGEAQRVKLATELAKVATGRTLYILDEPTTGLHFDDVRQLLEVLERLVDLGNSVVVIEHHLDVIRAADHLIDLGPEGGEAGGRIVATGTPEEVARVRASHTGAALREAAVARPLALVPSGAGAGGLFSVS